PALLKNNCQRVGLFARCASRAPSANRLVCGLPLADFGNDLAPDYLPLFRMTKEKRFAHDQFNQQGVKSSRVGLDELEETKVLRYAQLRYHTPHGDPTAFH